MVIFPYLGDIFTVQFLAPIVRRPTGFSVAKEMTTPEDVQQCMHTCTIVRMLRRRICRLIIESVF